MATLLTFIIMTLWSSYILIAGFACLTPYIPQMLMLCHIFSDIHIEFADFFLELLKLPKLVECYMVNRCALLCSPLSCCFYSSLKKSLVSCAKLFCLALIFGKLEYLKKISFCKLIAYEFLID